MAPNIEALTDDELRAVVVNWLGVVTMAAGDGLPGVAELYRPMLEAAVAEFRSRGLGDIRPDEIARHAVTISEQRKRGLLPYTFGTEAH